MSSTGFTGILTVVMPALNEEKNISDAITATLKAFDTFNIKGEIIVVDDGSRDATFRVAEKKAQEFPGRLRLMHHDKAKGVGFSFWEGVDNAQGDIVVMLPGDNENDPLETLRYTDLLEHVDIVIPFVFNKEERSLFRNFLSLVYRFIINSTFLVNFNYTNGTVLYRRSILKEFTIRSEGFFFQTDILVRAVRKGYLFAEVPYRLNIRKSGASKAISFPSLLQVAKGYLRLVKDYYFSKENGKDNFCGDSQTELRRKPR